METLGSFEAVLAAAEHLRAKGEKVTTRAVLALTKGSLSDISRHLRKIKADWAEAEKARDYGIGEGVINALRIDTRRHVQAALAAHQETLAEARQEIDELTEAYSASEARCQELGDELQSTRDKAAERDRSQETALAATTERIAAAEKRLRQVEVERDNALRGAEIARTEATKALLQVERADRAAGLAEERVATLGDQIEVLRQERAEALQRAAVAEQRADSADAARGEAREQIAGLQRQVETAQSELKELTARLLAAESRAASAEARLETQRPQPAPVKPAGKKPTSPQS